MLAGDRESIDTASILIAAVAEHYLRASIRESYVCVYIYMFEYIHTSTHKSTHTLSVFSPYMAVHCYRS